jgi:hypothetical protein
MPGYVSNVRVIVCLWATHRLGNRSPRSDTDGREFGPKRIQELLLYLTCRLWAARATNRHSSLLKEGRRNGPARHFDCSTAFVSLLPHKP